MKNSKKIVFSLQQSSSNQSLLFKTYNIINSIYFENFLECRLESDNDIEEFESSTFINLKNDILVKGGKANFNFEEFILLLKSIKFVAKYFELNPDEKLSKILKFENYPNVKLSNNPEIYGSSFNFEIKKTWYLDKLKELFENFNKTTKNPELLVVIESELKNFKYI
jgi:hypothetical protein